MTPIKYIVFLIKILFSCPPAEAQNFDEYLQEKIYYDYGIFRNPEKAAQASDGLRDFMSVQFVMVTGLAAYHRGFGNSQGWGLILTNMALRELNCATTEFVKESSRRQRPNGAGQNSFPSAHTSSSFSAATLIAYDLREIYGDEDWVTAVIYTNYTLAAAVAWFRMEAGYHYPLDVLVGGFIGFATAHYGKKWIHEGFNLQFKADSENVSASLSWHY